MKKSWQEKYDTGRDPVVTTLDRDFWGMKAGDTMLIATPSELDGLIRKISFGETKSVQDIRRSLAQKHGADFTCPLTTGIFLRIIAERALEQVASGVPLIKVTPFWRVIEPTSPLAKKLSCGPEFIQNLRNQEPAGR